MKSQFNRGHKEDALETIDETILFIQRINLLNYKTPLERNLSTNTVGLSMSLDYYDLDKNSGRAIIYYITLSYARQTNFGSINAKLIYSNRFETDNYQFKLDLY